MFVAQATIFHRPELLWNQEASSPYEPQEAPPLPTAVWMDLALLLPPFTTWVYIGLLRFHQPYNWAAHSCMAIHPCRLPPAGHGVQLVEFLAVPTWCVCCQIMERPEDFLKRKDEKGLFDRPTFHISGWFTDHMAGTTDLVKFSVRVTPIHSTKGPTTTLGLDGRGYQYHQQIDWMPEC